MDDTNRDEQADIPTGTDELAADAQASEPEKSKKANPVDEDEVVDSRPEPNPPHTTTGKFFTVPKFGAAGSGGLEIEPGLDVD
jgi:hypothetical protein